MAYNLPPIPNNPITDTLVWRDWFFKVSQVLVQQASIAWTSIDFTGSNIINIQTRQHNALQALDGGGTYHLSQSQYNAVAALPTFPLAFSNIDTTYGDFSNTADQILSGANTATKVAFNTTNTSSDMSLASNTITISKAGKYWCQYSLQAVNTDSQAHALYVWFRKNGSDITGSASKFDVPSSHGSSDGYLILVSQIIVDVAAGDTIEVYAACSNIYDPAVPSQGVYFEAYTASTSPYNRPSIPSNILTITQVA